VTVTTILIQMISI